MLNNLTGWHFLIILVVVLLLFGAPKLPGLARSLGQSMKIFKSEIKSDTVDGDTPHDATKPTVADDTSKASGSTDSSTKP
jgi:sec-independent protein translocase protein TatA